MCERESAYVCVCVRESECVRACVRVRVSACMNGVPWTPLRGLRDLVSSHELNKCRWGSGLLLTRLLSCHGSAFISYNSLNDSSSSNSQYLLSVCCVSNSAYSESTCKASSLAFIFTHTHTGAHTRTHHTHTYGRTNTHIIHTHTHTSTPMPMNIICTIRKRKAYIRVIESLVMPVLGTAK